MCAIPAPLVSTNRTAKIMTVFKQISRTTLFPLPLVSQIDPHVISWANVVFFIKPVGMLKRFSVCTVRKRYWSYLKVFMQHTVAMVTSSGKHIYIFLCTLQNLLTNLLRFKIFRDLLSSTNPRKQNNAHQTKPNQKMKTKHVQKGIYCRWAPYQLSLVIEHPSVFCC